MTEETVEELKTRINAEKKKLEKEKRQLKNEKTAIEREKMQINLKRNALASERTRYINKLDQFTILHANVRKVMLKKKHFMIEQARVIRVLQKKNRKLDRLIGRMQQSFIDTLTNNN